MRSPPDADCDCCPAEREPDVSGVEALPAPDLPSWLETLLVPGTRRYVVPVDGQLLHVMETGPKDGRPVLCVHGNPTWGFLWRKVAAELEGSSLRVVMPDLVGLGLSSKPRDPDAHTLRAHFAWLRGLVRALDLRGVVLALQDWGGAVGTGAFLDDRDRLAGLVVLNTVLGPPQPGFRPTLFHLSAHIAGVSDLLFRTLGFPQNVINFAQGDRRSISGPVARAYRWPLRGRTRNAGPLGLTRMVPDTMEHPSVPALRDVADFIAGWDGPSAIVWGRRDPILGRLERRTMRVLPQAPLTATEAGHFLQEEVPAEIASAVRDVVSRSG